MKKRLQSRTWRTRLVILASTLLLLLAVVATPLLSAPVRGLFMAAFSTVCHQLPERSVHVHGVALAVCSRCLGIYAGLFVGALGFPVISAREDWISRRTGMILLVGLAIPGLDWLAGVMGLWESGHVVRMITGAAFGIVGGYFLSRAAANLSHEAVPVSGTSDG